MARKSRKNTNQDSTAVKKPLFKTAIYTRLSVEDKKTQGNSIKGQISIANAYIEENPDLEFVNTFIDNGYTGANFQRPQFIEMMEEVQRGNINCIVIKDLSRLGRNYYEVIEYIDQIFPSLNVRLICVNEKLDTFDSDFHGEVMNVALRSLMNYAYIMDTSIKINSAFSSMRRKGYYLGSKPPYGYLKSKEDKHCLVVDEVAAKTVKQIFEQRLQGVSTSQIAKNLNFDGVPSPTNYHYEIGLMKNEKYSKSVLWSFTTVKTILTNQVYVGDIIGAKTRQHFGEVTKREQEEYVIVKDMHEAIISRSDFQKAAELMEQSAEAIKARIGEPTDIQKPERIFIGIIFCGCCKRPLSNFMNKRTHSYSAAYRCLDCNTYTDNNIYISFKDISNAVLETVQKHFASVISFEKISRNVIQSKEIQKQTDEIKNKIKANKQASTIIKNKISQIYLDYADGLINQEQFKKTRDDNFSKQNKLEKVIAELEKSLLIYDKNTKKSITGLAKQYRSIQSLNADTAKKVIERIEVFNDKYVEIEFKYDNEFRELKYLADLADTEVRNV